MAESQPKVTQLLHAWSAGDKAAFDQLVPLVFDELHRIAMHHLRSERAGHTLRPTDLVSEAYLRLSGSNPPALDDRVHFYSVAARCIRQILVDHARKHTAGKRGSGDKPVTFDEGLVGGERPEELLLLDAALEDLARFDERKARAIELHYFGGLTLHEIATVLEVHANTVSSDLRFGEAWIRKHLHAPV